MSAGYAATSGPHGFSAARSEVTDVNVKLAWRLAARRWLPEAHKVIEPSDDPGVMAVFHAAALIEPDPGKVMVWYCDTPIAQLNRMTARELVAVGQAGKVLAFLRYIDEDHED